MDKNTIKAMTPEQYRNELEENIFDDIEILINAGKGHASELHALMNDLDMVKRIIKEDKSFVSSFANKDFMYENIADAIYYKAGDISTWMTSERYEFSDPKDFHEYTLTLDMGGDPIGTGYDKELNEKESSYITIVLQRSLDNESPLGFFLKTAYVDIRGEHGIKTGKNFDIKHLEQDYKILKENKWEMLRFALKQKYPNHNIFLRKNNGEQSLVIDSKNEDRMIAFINENNEKIKDFSSETVSTINLFECTLKNPEFSDMLAYVCNKKKEYELNIKNPEIFIQKIADGPEQ